MSADGDTFDIDIYGDEEAQEEQPPQTEDHGVDGDYYGEDDGFEYGNDDGGEAPQTASASEPVPPQQNQQQQQQQPQPQESSQGTKRKAPSDETDSHRRTSSQVDPSATVALKLTDLHWWTTEEDLRGFCAAAKSESSLVDIAFGEHKINGKSRGEAYLEFSSPAAASAVKSEIEKKETGNTSNGEAKRANPFHVYFTVAGNPFKGRDSGAVGKKEYNTSGPSRGGAYNNFNNNHRGGFAGRGGGGFNRGGGGFNRGGGYMNHNNNNNNNMMNNQNWGMGNGGMGMGFGGNPMMAMGGYGNMGRGNMGGMMGRGGFGGMGNMGNMGAMMGMGGRGGGGMMMGGGRGGWGGGGMMGGGMQSGYAGNFGGGMGSQQGGQGQQQNNANKRMKAE